MILFKLTDLAKATKYLRRWRGSDGKWHYKYNPDKGRGSSESPPTGAHKGSLKGVTAKEVKELLKHYARKPAGMGKEKTIQTKRDLGILLKHSTFALMSAGRNPKNEEDMKLDDATIKARHGKLLSRLKDEGYIYTQCRGKYENPEESIMVMMHDSDKESAMAIGAAFNQDSVVFCSKGKNEMINTTGESKGELSMDGSGYAEVPDANDYYTKMPLGVGGTVKFTMLMEDVEKAMRNFMRMGASVKLFVKAKKMPIGTVSRGRKKVAEGRWVPVSSGGSSGKSKAPDTRSVAEKMRDAVPKGPKASALERKAMSKAIQGAVNKSYYDDVPIEAIDSALKKTGFLLVQEDGMPWSGMLIGNDSHTVLQIGRMHDFVERDGLKMHTILSNAGVALSWYRDDKRSSSKYDIVAYLS